MPPQETPAAASCRRGPGAHAVHALLYLNGDGIAKARYTRYGFLLLETDLDGGRQNRLPLSRKALAGFQTLDPSRTRDPIPFDVIARLCQYFLDQGQLTIAVLLVSQFVTYSRPSEALRVQPEEFVTAPRGAAAAFASALTVSLASGARAV